jgi:hypothetical protein
LKTKISNCYNCGKEMVVKIGTNKYILCEECKRSGIKIEKYTPEKKLEILEKRKKTNLEKYGTEFVAQNKNIKEKTKKTNLEKYGVENPQQNKEVKEKTNNTILKKYGVDNISQLDEIKEKKKETCFKNFGVDNPFHSKIIINKAVNTRKEKEFIPKVVKYLKYFDLELLDVYSNFNNEYSFRCLKCNNIFKSTFFNVWQRIGKCPKCCRNYNISNEEKELVDYIKSLNLEIQENIRNLIPPYELDISIPTKNIAIEFNGLYWHSEINKSNKFYHFNKLKLCKDKGIKLIQIFEDEWLFKKDIVKSRLKHILNNNDNIRINARKCIIKEIDSKTKNEFLELYHIQGKDTSNIKLGAFYNNQLISIMTFSHGNISKGSKSENNIWELNRFCSNHNYHIPGIASKLLTYFKRNYFWNEIFSYADLRWSEGNVYYKLGFILDYITKPNYWYFKNQKRIHRFNLRKRKDEPKDISERLLRLKEGYERIWDCGNMKFIMING